VEPSDLSSNQLAKNIGVTPARINEIVRSHRGITADTAPRLAQYFNTDAQSWMNLQHHYALGLAEQAIGKEVANIQPIAAAVYIHDKPVYRYLII